MSSIHVPAMIPMYKADSKFNMMQEETAVQAFDLKVGEVSLSIIFKINSDDLVVYATNETPTKAFKCIVESYVMAHKAGKTLIHAKSLSLPPQTSVEWKIQDKKYFEKHCLSKRQQRNELVIRFQAKVLLEIKSWSVVNTTVAGAVKESPMSPSSSKTSFAAAAESVSTTEKEPIDFDVVPLQLHCTDKGATLRKSSGKKLEENKGYREVECLILNRKLGPVSLGSQDINEDWVWQLDFEGISQKLGLTTLADTDAIDNLVFLRRKGERQKSFDNSPSEATDSN